jgi:hypothetical protein
MRLAHNTINKSHQTQYATQKYCTQSMLVVSYSRHYFSQKLPRANYTPTRHWTPSSSGQHYYFVFESFQVKISVRTTNILTFSCFSSASTGTQNLQSGSTASFNTLLNSLFIDHSINGVLGVVTRLIYPLLPSRQPHLPVAYPVSTDEVLTTESQRDICYISAGENSSTHRVFPEALKVATLPLDCHSLG